MIQQVYESEFIDSLTSDEYANFTYSGARALYDYLTDLEEDIGEEIQFNRIAIRCDYSEYKTLDEILDQYDYINTLDELRDHTTVIEFDNGFIIQKNF
tara:strand:+ start:246 stop:539 length:294 start_codon:yes stop_codon:yes gene_type:complete